MRIFLTAFVLFSLLQSAEVSIVPDKDSSVSNEDIQHIQYYYKKYFNILLSEKGAKKIVKENRLLANAYLKKYGLSKNVKNLVRIVDEFILADQMVQKIQNNIKIPPKVLHTYYLDNIEKFKNDDLVKLKSFLFESPEEAISFYIESKNKPLEDIVKLAKRHNVKTIRDYQETTIGSLTPFLKNNLKKGKQNYLLPPQLGSSYEVFYVIEYKSTNSYKPFEEVKEKIEKTLHKKRYLEERKRILSSLMKEEER
jgi:hypothetical protein